MPLPRSLQNMPGVSGKAGADLTHSRTTTTRTGPQSTSIAMLNLSRRSINALEDSTKSVRRSTAAKQKATQALVELMRDEDVARPTTPPLPAKNQPPRK